MDYKSHESALKAMNHLHWGNVKIFGVDVVVDWAETQEDPDSDAMEKVLFFLFILDFRCVKMKNWILFNLPLIYTNAFYCLV